MDEALIEVPTMHRFARIDMISDRTSDMTTIPAFRHLLEIHNLGEQIFQIPRSQQRSPLGLTHPPGGKTENHETDLRPGRGLARKADGTPQSKTQRNFTDADSHLMKSDGHYIQGYNCQLAVDTDHQVIVAVGVSNQPPDVEHLEPMLERIAASVGALPDVMTLDAGYWSENNADRCEDLGIDAYIATGRLPHGQPPPPKRGPMPRNADAKARMARKIRSKKGAKIYAQRKAIVEPVNGQIKEARGLRRFLLKGIEKVSGEWHLIATTHNLLKLFRFRRSQQQAQVAATG